MTGLLYVFAVWSGQRSSEQPLQPQPASQRVETVRRADHAAAAPAPAPQPTFAEYPCASADCREHKTGFRWAEAHAIADPDSCTGNSGAFVEGCRVYAERHAPPNWADPDG